MTEKIADPGRVERVLAYMIAAVVGLSILSFVATIIGTTAGVGANDGFSQGVWPAVLVFPLIGLPIGFLLIIALMVINARGRSRQNRADNAEKQ